MKPVRLAALALTATLPAWAQDAGSEGPIDANFTWSVVDLASIPAGADAAVHLREAHIVITGKEPGLFDRLGGRCLMLVNAAGESFESTGSCQLADAEGNQIFERIEEVGGQGHAVITGGTGKFAGLSGEYDFDTSGWYTSLREGMDQGVGTKTGTWHMSGS
jgi:hypothetical protein